MSFLKNLGAKPLEQSESHPINQQTKELEATKAYLTAVSKKIKKTVKTTQTLLRGTQDVAKGCEQWSTTIAAFDSESHLGRCLGTVSNFQTYFGDLLATLGTSIDMKVTEPMVDFTKEEIPATQAVKKKWDSTRKDYDAAISKVLLLQKEKKPNPPKIQQAEQDRDRLKAIYLSKGEEAFCSLLDTNEMSEFATLEQLLTYIEAFYQFFRGGYNFLRDVHDNVVISHRQWIAEERGRYEQRRKKRAAGEWVPDSISGGSAAKTRMFGLPYDEVIRRDNPPNLIPLWLEKAIEFLEQRALGIQGVFRISPPKTQLDETKKKIDSAQEIDWTSLDEHVCTGTIKLFLRELPQPLLTFDLYSKFVAAADAEEDPAKIKAIKQVVSDLPKPNLALLKRLLSLIVLIERNKDVNKMTATNLAVVLCPSILYPEVPDPLTMVEDIQRANRVMALMITHFSDIFGHIVTGPKSVSFSTSNNTNSTHITGTTSSSNMGTSSDSITATHPERLNSSSSGKRVDSPSSSASSIASPSSSAPSIASPTKGTPSKEPEPTASTSVAPAVAASAAPTAQISTAQPSHPTVTTPHSNPPVAVSTAAASIPIASVDATPKIDLATMKMILKEKSVGSTYEYFMGMQETADATCQFASLALKPGLSLEHVPMLNAALKNLAKAIKNILASVKDFALKLPPELRGRLLLAAKELQDRVLSTATAFKEFGEGAQGAAARLVEATKHLVVASYAMGARLKEFSLVDELLAAGESIGSLLDELPASFADDATSIAVNTNSLQNASFKLTALLRAKILDSSQQSQIGALVSCVENAERDTRSICEAIKAMLFDESLGPDDIVISPALDSKLKSLASTSKQVESFVEMLSPGQNLSVNNASLFAPVTEQLNANINTHSSNPDPTMQSIVAAMRSISSQLAVMQPLVSDIASKRVQWLDALYKISEQFGVIATAVQHLYNSTSDPTVQLTLSSYLRTLSTLGLLIRIVAPAEAFDVQACSDALNRSMTFVKDFVFVSFPVLFNIRDAIALIEEERVST